MIKEMNKNEQRIKGLQESILEIKQNQEELSKMKDVQKYLANLQKLEEENILLTRLATMRYCDQEDCYFESVCYPFLQRHLNPTFSPNYQRRIIVSEEVFLKRILLLARDAGFLELSSDTLEQLRNIVLSSIQKDIVYEDEPYDLLAGDIKVYLDPKFHEVECLKKREIDEEPVVLYDDIILGQNGNFFLRPTLDFSAFEKEYGISSIQTEREKASFTTEKIKDFFHSEKSDKKSYQKKKSLK